MTNEATIRSVGVTMAGDGMGTPGVLLTGRREVTRIFVGGDQARETERGDQPIEAPGPRKSGRGLNRSLNDLGRSAGGGESDLGEPEESENTDRVDAVEVDIGDAEQEESDYAHDFRTE
jgi:hypothetical protein